MLVYRHLQEGMVCKRNLVRLCITSGPRLQLCQQSWSVDTGCTIDSDTESLLLPIDTVSYVKALCQGSLQRR